MKKIFYSILVLLLTTVTSAWAEGYNVVLMKDTKDAANWTITPIMPFAEGTRVTVTYAGANPVKRVIALQKSAPETVKLSYELKDSWGDGWGKNWFRSYIEVLNTKTRNFFELTFDDGYSAEGVFELVKGEYEFVWYSGLSSYECSFVIRDSAEKEIISGSGRSLSDGLFFTYVTCAHEYLTDSGDGKTWTLAAMPAYDVELLVITYTEAELNQMAADKVIPLIDAIAPMADTEACRQKIKDARAAHDALTDAQKACVSNYNTLAADEVMVLIYDIGAMEDTDACRQNT